MSALLDAALDYTNRGWPVFPCTPGTKIPPKGTHGFLDATTDEQQIRAWWKRWPNANIGIPTGMANTFDVIDIDDPDRAREWWFTHAPADDPLWWGPCVLTRRGYHLWHATCGERTTTVVAKVVDFKAGGGYVIVPPSVVDGHVYTFEPGQGADEPLEPAPRWFVDVVKSGAGTDRGTPISSGRTFPVGTNPYGLAALEREVGRVVMAPSGDRNNTLNKAAYSLGQLVGARVLDARGVAEHLLAAALQIGLDEREAGATIASGMSKGMQQPRRVAS